MLRKSNVVDGALAFLDTEGLDALTMRKLGASLNVQGGALYRHYPSKEALLDAVADRILAGYGDAAEELADLDWQEQIRRLCDRLRAALLAHRDGARVVSATFAPGTNTIVGTELAVSVLCRAGLPPARAGWLVFTLFYYVLGYVIEEQGQAALAAGDDLRARNARADVELSAEYSEAVAALDSGDPDERFRYGVDTFIAGIEAQVER
ncbi:TetR/AcrR family transcriptional regulator C-terminal domain-containing protein [Gordonia sp. (in: high G+C Gram-positive bacteria)]|uniref:TetR/AcrR family transcriptional regulator C-terminal domain-containing protein n=1 Tax=Gordonia sp. (in: high G+C Gram-positive bacteria) TaxID=84139 RepID=UPI0039E4CECC